MARKHLNEKSSILLFFFFLITIQFCYSQNQDRKFEGILHGNYFLTGELNSIYNTTLGAEFQYYFSKTSAFEHYFNTGFTTDIDTKGTNLFAFDLGIGTQYKLTELWNKPLFIRGSIGGLYWQEKFSTQFINTTVNSSVSEFGFKANLGIGYRFTKRMTFILQGTQFSTKGTSVGIGISYSF